MHEVFAGEHANGTEAFLGKPAVQCFQDAIANESGAEYASVEQDVGWGGEATGAATHGS